MVRRLSDSELCYKVWDVLSERLGPADAMRFLSLTRTPSRDYQAWRDERFKGITVADLFRAIDPTPPKSP